MVANKEKISLIKEDWNRLSEKIVVMGEAASAELEWEQKQQMQPTGSEYYDSNPDMVSRREVYLQALIDARSHLLGYDPHGEADVNKIETIIEKGRSRYAVAKRLLERYPVLGEEE